MVLLIAAPGWTFAQSETDLVNFLEAGKNDASKLMGAYLNPMIEGLSYSFNGGWYHTAKAHNSLGFDLGFPRMQCSYPAQNIILHLPL